MIGKVIRYGKNHQHVYTFDKSSNEWKFVGCRMTGDMDRCTGLAKSLPAGTKFDGSVKLNEQEEYA